MCRNPVSSEQRVTGAVAALLPIRSTEGAPAALERVTGAVAALLPIRSTEGAPAALERVTGIEPA